MRWFNRLFKSIKRQGSINANNIKLDDVCKLLGGYYRCSAKDGYPFLFLSDNFLDILGWTKKEIEQNFDNKLFNMLHPYDKKNLLEDKTNALDIYKQGSCKDTIVRLLGKNGYHWVSDSYSVLKSDSGLFFQGNITDISDYMKEREVKDEERNQMMSALTMDYTTVIMGDLKQNTMVVVKDNGQMYNDYGIDDLFMGDNKNYMYNLRNFYENILVKESFPNFMEILSPIPFMDALKNKDSVEIQYKIMPNRAGYETLYARAIRLYDDTHHFKFVMGFRPMDEIRKKENVLELQREIIEGIGKDYFSVLLLDLDNGQIYSFREAGKDGKRISDFCRTYHDLWVDFLPAYAQNLVSEETRQSFLDELSLEMLQSKNEDFSMTYEYLSDTGILYYQARVSYVKKRDRTRAVVIGTRNIDDLIQKERIQKEKLREAYVLAENASRAKTDFLNNMSHDIRTPMNVILGYNQLMKEELTDPKLMDYQKKIEQSGNLLLSIINDVLDMARIESGKTELVEKPDVIVDIIEKVSNVFGAMAKEKEIQMNTSIDIKHANILCDSTKVKEILVNLVGNAIKYTPNGGTVTINVQEIPSSRDGYAKFKTEIIDTGIGMSESFIPTLFDSFTRETTKDTGNIMGTGLGMSIVKKLLDMMNGTIDVESKLGKGSCFTITIEHQIADEDIKTSNDNVLKSYQSLEGKHVLLAEDNELNAEIAQIILERCGLVVDWVKDGIECVGKVIQKPNKTYDLILMDIQMPTMNGYIATQKIRELPDKEKSNIPIIAMTANAFEEDKKNALDAGMDGHISKPIDIDKLKREITSTLTKKLKL